MTDEELSRVIHNLGNEFRPDSPYSRRLVLAGYRAGLEEAHAGFVEIRREQSAKDACETYGWWLDAKLKEAS